MDKLNRLVNRFVPVVADDPPVSNAPMLRVPLTARPTENDCVGNAEELSEAIGSGLLSDCLAELEDMTRTARLHSARLLCTVPDRVARVVSELGTSHLWPLLQDLPKDDSYTSTLSRAAVSAKPEAAIAVITCLVHRSTADSVVAALLPLLSKDPLKVATVLRETGRSSMKVAVPLLQRASDNAVPIAAISAFFEAVAAMPQLHHHLLVSLPTQRVIPHAHVLIIARVAHPHRAIREELWREALSLWARIDSDGSFALTTTAVFVNSADESAQESLVALVMALLRLCRTESDLDVAGAEGGVGLVLRGVSQRMSSTKRWCHRHGALVACRFAELMRQSGTISADDQAGLTFDEWPRLLEDYVDLERALLQGSGERRSAVTECPDLTPTVGLRLPPELQPPPSSGELDPDAPVCLSVPAFSFSSVHVASFLFAGGVLPLVPQVRTDDPPLSTSPVVLDELPVLGSVADPASGGVEEALKAARRQGKEIGSLRHLPDIIRALTQAGENDYAVVEAALLAALPILQRKWELARLSDSAHGTDVASYVALFKLCVGAFSNAVVRGSVKSAVEEMMGLVVALAPQAIAVEAGDAVYSHHFTIAQRVSVLHAVARGAEKLSSVSKSDVPVERNVERHKSGLLYPPIPSEEKALSVDVRAIIHARVESNTRRWGNASRTVAPSVLRENRLAVHSEGIIFALLLRYDTGHYAIMGDDVYVAVELLRTLGGIVAALSLAQRSLDRLGEPLTSFAGVVTRHRHPAVRTATWALLAALFTMWRPDPGSRWFDCATTAAALSDTVAEEPDPACRAIIADVQSIVAHNAQYARSQCPAASLATLSELRPVVELS